MRLAATLALATLITIGAGSSNAGLDPIQLQKEIQKNGVREVAAALFANKSSWAALTENVRTGRSEWIDVAVRLRGGTDGGASSELKDALFAALATNPRRVLQISAPTVPINVLCSGRSDPLETAKAALSEIDRIRQTVARIHDRDIVDQQKECLSALEVAETNTKRFFGE